MSKFKLSVLLLVAVVSVFRVGYGAGPESQGATTKASGPKFRTDFVLDVEIQKPNRQYSMAEPIRPDVAPGCDLEIPAGYEWTISLDEYSLVDLSRLVDQLNKFHRSGGPMPAIELYGFPLIDSDYKAMARIEGSWKLWISGTGMSVVDDSSLAKIAKLKNLTGLTLWGNTAVTDAGIKHLVGMENLTSLNISKCRGLTDIALAHIGRLKRLAELKVPWKGKFTVAGFKSLSGMTKLRSLDVSADREYFDRGPTYIDARLLGNEILIPISKLRSLEELDLSGNSKISDAGMGHLVSLRRLKRLQLGG